MSEQERNTPEILRGERPENHKLRIGGEGGAEHSIGEQFIFNGTKVIFSKIGGELAHFLVFLEGEDDETLDLQIEVQLEIKNIADLQEKIEAAIRESQALNIGEEIEQSKLTFNENQEGGNTEKERQEKRKHALDYVVIAYLANSGAKGFGDEKQSEVIRNVIEKIHNELFTSQEFESMTQAQITNWVHAVVDAEIKRITDSVEEQRGTTEFESVSEVIEYAKNFAQAYMYSDATEQYRADRLLAGLAVDTSIVRTLSASEFKTKSKKEIEEIVKGIVDFELLFENRKDEVLKWSDLERRTQKLTAEETNVFWDFVQQKMEQDAFRLNNDRVAAFEVLKREATEKIREIKEMRDSVAAEAENDVPLEDENEVARLKADHIDEVDRWRWSQTHHSREQYLNVLSAQGVFFELNGEYDRATDKEKAVRDFIERQRKKIETRESDEESDFDFERQRDRYDDDFEDDNDEDKGGKEPRTVEEIIEQIHGRYQDKEKRERLIGAAVSDEIYQPKHQRNVNEEVDRLKKTKEGLRLFADRTEQDEAGNDRIVENRNLDILIDKIKKSKKELEKEIKKELAEGGSPNAKIELMREQEIAIADLETAKTRKEEMTQAFDDHNDHDFWGQVANSPIMLAHMVRRLGSTADAKNSLLRARLSNAIPATWPGIVRKPLRAIVGGVIGIPKFVRLAVLGIIPMAVLFAGASIANWSLNKGMDWIAQFTKTDVRKWFKSKK